MLWKLDAITFIIYRKHQRNKLTWVCNIKFQLKSTLPYKNLLDKSTESGAKWPGCKSYLAVTEQLGDLSHSITCHVNAYCIIHARLLVECLAHRKHLMRSKQSCWTALCPHSQCNSLSFHILQAVIHQPPFYNYPSGYNGPAWLTLHNPYLQIPDSTTQDDRPLRVIVQHTTKHLELSPHMTKQG